MNRVFEAAGWEVDILAVEIYSDKIIDLRILKT
jgi:hypothetical protein